MRLIAGMAARRSGIVLVLVGFVTGVVLTMSLLSVRIYDYQHHVMISDDISHSFSSHHHHHHQRQQQTGGGSSEGVQVVDLTQQDRHKHTGLSVRRLSQCAVCQIALTFGQRLYI